MKKILIISGIFPPEIGGPANYTKNLAKKLKEKGYDVTVLTYANRTDKIVAVDYPVVRVFRTNTFSNYFRFFMKTLSLVSKFEIVYALDWFSAGFPLYCASLLTGKKYILRIGGGYIWEKYLAEDKPPLPLKDFYVNGLQQQYPLMFWIIKKVLRRASFVIFNSRTQKDLYIKFYKLSLDKVAVVQNPMDPIKNIDTKERGTPEKIIVFAGRFIAMKNIAMVIKAFSKLNDTSFKLRIIGDGPKQKELVDLTHVLGLEKRVSFEPALLQKDLYESIKNCYFVVIPSWTDISPNQVYECLSYKIPVLLTRENYLDIGITDNFLIDPNSLQDITNKMNMLLDPVKYEELKKDFFSVKLPKNWDDVTTEHINIFNKIYTS